MAAQSAEIKTSLAQTIKKIADLRISNLKLDKTVQAKVEKVLSKDRYSLTYNGGTMYATATEGFSFLPGASVYVLIPQGDFSKNKTIISRVSGNVQDNYNLANVASAIDSYSVIGNNILSINKDKNENNFPYTISSFGETDINGYQQFMVLYRDNIEEEDEGYENYINVDVNKLNTYIKKSGAFLFGAKFKTRLPSSQIYNSVGNYGLILTIKVKNDGSIYINNKDEWDNLEPQTGIKVYNKNFQEEYKRLNDYKKMIEAELEITSITEDSFYDDRVKSYNDEDFQLVRYIFNKIESDLTKLENYMTAAVGKVDDSAFNLISKYYSFMEEFVTYTIDEKGNSLNRDRINEIYQQWFNEPTGEQQYKELVYEYDLDTSYMLGNPYNFKDYSYQYLIQTIDPNHFVGISGIYFFCQGFSGQNNEKVSSNQNIAVKDLEFYCLEEADEDTGDYKLSLVYPEQGAVFNSKLISDTLTIGAKVIYSPQSSDFTSFCYFRWFKQDKSVTSPDSEGYSSWGGVGWRLLNDIASVSSYTFNAAECKAYENIFMCVAAYDLNTVLRKEFTLFNTVNDIKFEIVSDSGAYFKQGEDTKTLICTVNNETEVENENWSFVWSKTINNQTIIFETEKQEDGTEVRYDSDWYEAEIKRISESEDYKNGKITLEQIKPLQDKKQMVQGFVWDKNKLIYPGNQISFNQTVYVNCTIYETDNGNTYEIGSATIALKRGEISVLRDYYINIVNGDQVFQYSESGVSPASERYEQPYKIQDLKCELYTPNGGIISENNYKVRWQWPLVNTMLVIDPNLAEENKSTGDLDTYNRRICPVNISENYLFDSVNNQITCLVEYENATYKETTNFYFGKIGENGTNGTDVVAKISPIVETTNTVLQDELLTLIHYDYSNSSDRSDFTAEEFVTTIKEIEQEDEEGNIKTVIVPDIDGSEEDECRWNYGESSEMDVLKLELYKRNELVPAEQYKNVKWTINGSSSKIKSRMTVNASTITNIMEKRAVVLYEKPTANDETQYFHNYVVEGRAALDMTDGDGNTVQQNYYYNYPIPVITDRSQLLNRLNPNESFAEVRLDKELTMRQALYNSDGRAPQYNENQGVKLIFKKPDFKSKELLPLGLYEINWSVGGGFSSADENTSALRIYDPYTKTLVNEYTTQYYSEKDQLANLEQFLKEKGKIQEDWEKVEQEYITEWNKETNTEDDKQQIYAEYLMAYEQNLEKLEEIDKQIEEAKITSTDFIKVVPQDVYNGEYNNNFVRAKVYRKIVDISEEKIETTEEEGINSTDSFSWDIYNSFGDIVEIRVTTTDVIWEEKTTESGEKINERTTITTVDRKILVADIIVPIYLSLNTYGLSSLNAWDGNSIEINEDEKYILAPQVGAGKKNIEDNTFTGLVMGVEKTYDADNNTVTQIGLHGYNHGKQSIFLDAETGNATFGLPETEALEAGNPLTEGRIELRPGSTSKISQWRFDARSIYRVAAKLETDELKKEGILSERHFKGHKFNNDSTYRELGAPYEDAPKDAHGSIPHDQQGILLSAVPAYASFKGRQLDENDYGKSSGKIDYFHENTTIRPEDTFELQIDPNSSRLFSIFEHTKAPEGNIVVDGVFNNNGLSDLKIIERTFKKNDSGDQSILETTVLSVLKNQGNYYYWELQNQSSKGKYVAALRKEINSSDIVWIYYAYPKKPSSGVIKFENGNTSLTKFSKDDENFSKQYVYWRRRFKAGIDAQGHFTAEGVGNNNMGFGLDRFSAFWTNNQYEGARILKGTDALIKFFTIATDDPGEADPLFISTSSNLAEQGNKNSDEGLRSINIYSGDYLDIYSGTTKGTIYPIEDRKTIIRNNITNKNNKKESITDEDRKYTVDINRLFLLNHSTDSTFGKGNRGISLGSYGGIRYDATTITRDKQQISYEEFYNEQTTELSLNRAKLQVKLSAVGDWKTPTGKDPDNKNDKEHYYEAQSELLLDAFNPGSIGHLIHTGGWETNIGKEYNKIIGGALTATYNDSAKIINNGKVEIEQTTVNGLTYKQIQKNTGTEINNFNILPTGEGKAEPSIQLLHNSEGQIQIIQNSKDRPYGQIGTQIVKDKKEPKIDSTLKNSKLQLGVIGTQNGISFYTRDGNAFDDISAYSYMFLLPQQFALDISGTRTENGTDKKGNPKYKLEYGRYVHMTEDSPLIETGPHLQVGSCLFVGYKPSVDAANNALKSYNGDIRSQAMKDKNVYGLWEDGSEGNTTSLIKWAKEHKHPFSKGLDIHLEEASSTAEASTYEVKSNVTGVRADIKVYAKIDNNSRVRISAPSKISVMGDDDNETYTVNVTTPPNPTTLDWKDSEKTIDLEIAINNQKITLPKAIKISWADKNTYHPSIASKNWEDTIYGTSKSSNSV